MHRNLTDWGFPEVEVVCAPGDVLPDPAGLRLLLCGMLAEDSEVTPARAAFWRETMGYAPERLAALLGVKTELVCAWERSNGLRESMPVVAARLRLVWALSGGRDIVQARFGATGSTCGRTVLDHQGDWKLVSASA